MKLLQLRREGGKVGKNSKEGGRVGKERERREKISKKGEDDDGVQINQ